LNLFLLMLLLSTTLKDLGYYYSKLSQEVPAYSFIDLQAFIKHLLEVNH
jgi:hypothetical protein